MISREQAAEIAKADAAANGSGTEVSNVFRAREIASRAPMLYGIDLERCWVAYMVDPRPPALRSSTIVVVDMESGVVAYRGSANDEG